MRSWYSVNAEPSKGRISDVFAMMIACTSRGLVLTDAAVGGAVMLCGAAAAAKTPVTQSASAAASESPPSRPPPLPLLRPVQ